MPLDFEEYDEDADNFLGHARQFAPRRVTETYEGVGDDPLAGDVLVGGVAELGCLGVVGPGGPGAHHPLEP